MRSPCCLCIPRINFRMPEQVFTKVGIHAYIMAPEAISVTHFINPSYHSVYTPIAASQWLGRHVSAARNTLNSRSAEGAVFYKVRGSLCVSQILVYIRSKRWSESSHSRHTVKYSHETEPRITTLTRASNYFLDWAYSTTLKIEFSSETQISNELHSVISPKIEYFINYSRFKAY
jgi:hypothetical protein